MGSSERHSAAKRSGEVVTAVPPLVDLGEIVAVLSVL
jgi:hypothetical protein